MMDLPNCYLEDAKPGFFDQVLYEPPSGKRYWAQSPQMTLVPVLPQLQQIFGQVARYLTTRRRRCSVPSGYGKDMPHDLSP